MTFEQWWDSAANTPAPNTFKNWEESCRQAWEASYAEATKDAARYRFCINHNMVLSGGTVSFGWPIAPVGKEWDKYIDSAMAAAKGGAV